MLKLFVRRRGDVMKKLWSTLLVCALAVVSIDAGAPAINDSTSQISATALL